MELTIDQALQEGVAAHREGKLQDAERLYRAILQSQPAHPDANHCLGVVAVGVGKVQEALPLFKRALEANPKQEQFWLSYIDALIKLGQLDNARQILEQGKDSGLKGEKINQLEVQLSNTVSASSLPAGNSSNPSKQQIDGLIVLYKEGKLQEALIQGNALASQFPSNPILPNILGIIYSGSGQYEEAVTSYNKAIELKSNYADAYNNLGNAFNKLGKSEEAIASYTQAIQFKPDYAEAHNNRGSALKGLGHYEEAITSYNKAIEFKSDYTGAHYNRGDALSELGKYEEAITSYNKAIELKSDYADAHNNRGNILNRLGKYEEAIASYNKAIECKPDYTEVYNNLGIALSSIHADAFSEPLAKNYLDILNFETIIRPSSLVGSIITLLKHHDIIKETISYNSQDKLEDLTSEFCLHLSQLSLFLKIMEICPLPDLEIEKLLTGLRRKLLLERNKLSNNDDLLLFQRALALQCFTNEFIYEETEEETIALQSLEAGLQKSFSNNEELSSYDIACLASYRSLFEYPWATDVTPPPTLELLFKRQVIEVKQERLLRENIPSFNPIKDDVSVAVQSQYEENPYPRWVNTKLEIKPMSIKTVMAKLELQVVNEAGLLPEAPQILIAGCGTGQHSLNAASLYKGSHITAIDLSLSSLAYAKRKTEELGVTNIDYQQADILDLGVLDKQFDIIESAGVLHHMAEPLAGWRVLTDCLKSGGMMKIGLYSELARQSVVKARDMIAKNKITSDKEEMLKFRREIIKLNDAEVNGLEKSTDFYSTSTVRDLLFHVQEHRFTIPQIRKALDELGLTFMGFAFPDKTKTNAFKAAYPKEGAIYNLDNWHEYETLNPRLFAGMYQFWVQKP